MVEITDAAAHVLKRSLELGNVDASRGGIRLRPARTLGGGFGVQIELADGPAEGDQVVETAGLRLFLDRALTEAMPHPVITLDPQHDTITVSDRGAGG